VQLRAGAPRARFVFGSLALHGLLLGLLALRQASPAKLLRPREAPSIETAVELVPDSESAAAAPLTEAPPVAASPAKLRGGRGVPILAARAPSPEAASLAAPASEAGAVPITAPSAATAPPLTLAQLGVDGPNPFLDRREDPVALRAAKARAVKRRLDRALAQGLTDADVARGRGAHGPVLRVLEAAVYASNVPLDGQASFVFVIDGNGKLLSATLGSATGDRSAWLRVAQQTLHALNQQSPRPRRQGVKVTVAVSSRLELPSGADPGLEISAQGVPVKKGAGPRSARLDLSIFPFPAATLAGDPADIGARPRRMVHSSVVSEEPL
jgi:hypothetical protein